MMAHSGDCYVLKSYPFGVPRCAGCGKGWSDHVPRHRSGSGYSLHMVAFGGKIYASTCAPADAERLVPQGEKE